MKRATSDDLCAAMLPLEAEKTVNVEYERSSVGVGGRLRAQIDSRLVRKRQSGANNIAGGRESGRGDDFTFARTGVELKKIRMMLCEWYGVKVRGMLGSAPNAQMEGWRIGVQSERDTPTNVFEKCDLGVNIVSSAAVKTEDTESKEDETGSAALIPLTTCVPPDIDMSNARAQFVRVRRQ